MCSQWWWRRLRKKQSIQVVEDLYCQNIKATQIRGLVDNLPFLPQKTKQNKLPELALSKHKSQFWSRQWMIRIFRRFVPLGPCHSKKQSQRGTRSAIRPPPPTLGSQCSVLRAFKAVASLIGGKFKQIPDPSRIDLTWSMRSSNFCHTYLLN